MTVSAYEFPPIYTAQQVHDDVAAGMDPDSKLVSAYYFDAMKADRDSEMRWACEYKDERDRLQRRLDKVLAMLKDETGRDNQ